MKLPFMLEMVDLELVAKGKLGNLLLHLGELVIVLRDPLQDVLDELALCVTDGDGELEVAEDDNGVDLLDDGVNLLGDGG